MGGFRTVMAMVRELHDYLGITVPVAVHLDHGHMRFIKSFRGWIYFNYV